MTPIEARTQRLLNAALRIPQDQPFTLAEVYVNSDPVTPWTQVGTAQTAMERRFWTACKRARPDVERKEIQGTWFYRWPKSNHNKEQA